jgi:hypothetical protein
MADKSTQSDRGWTVMNSWMLGCVALYLMGAVPMWMLVGLYAESDKTCENKDVYTPRGRVWISLLWPLFVIILMGQKA